MVLNCTVVTVYHYVFRYYGFNHWLRNTHICPGRKKTNSVLVFLILGRGAGGYYLELSACRPLTCKIQLRFRRNKHETILQTNQVERAKLKCKVTPRHTVEEITMENMLAESRSEELKINISVQYTHGVTLFICWICVRKKVLFSSIDRSKNKERCCRVMMGINW